MNKNKKITVLVSLALLTSVFATGCGANPEKIESNIEKFVKAHENIGAAIVNDSFVFGFKEGLDNEVVDYEKYLVLEEVLKEEKKNLNSIKNKELKQLNKIANEFYGKASDMIKKGIEGDLDLEEFVEKAEEINEDVLEKIEDGELIDAYNELREKVEMDEYDYDEYELGESFMEAFSKNHGENIKKMIKKVTKKMLGEAGLNSDLSDLISGLNSNDTSSEDDSKSDSVGGFDTEDSKKEVSDGVIDKFLKSIAENKAEEEEIYADEESGSIYLNGSSDGTLSVYVSHEDNELDYISLKIDGNGDEAELSERMISIIEKFCKELGLDKEKVFKGMKELYDETSSKEFLESPQGKKDIEEYDFITNEAKFGDIKMDMIIFKPDKSVTKKVEFTIMDYSK